ncbi:MAG: UDP-N-acetylglucosamine 2-epimerase (hydrolyzing), partial [Lentisphaeraceae bacterium]|nr:UDP-N-acetylglucosamine 2-epimerase (hydrolyzing) [Lentisphaeraceae bacterium]
EQSAIILQECGVFFEEEKCDAFIVLGDRFEMLAAAQAALLTATPIFHIGGGYNTFGAIDEQIRHAISKLSDYHFVASEGCAKNVRALNERNDRIFISGAPDLEILQQTSSISRAEFKETTGIASDFVLVTFHPETHSSIEENRRYMEIAEKFLLSLDKEILITAPCADPGADDVFAMIKRLRSKNKKVFYRDYLGVHLFVNALRFADCMIGNSSSGIIEAGSFQLPVINIGDRQAGRECAENVIHSSYELAALREAYIHTKNTDFLDLCKRVKNPYGDGNFCVRFIEALSTIVQ